MFYWTHTELYGQSHMNTQFITALLWDLYDVIKRLHISSNLVCDQVLKGEELVSGRRWSECMIKEDYFELSHAQLLIVNKNISLHRTLQ